MSAGEQCTYEPRALAHGPEAIAEAEAVCGAGGSGRGEGVGAMGGHVTHGERRARCQREGRGGRGWGELWTIKGHHAQRKLHRRGRGRGRVAIEQRPRLARLPTMLGEPQPSPQPQEGRPRTGEEARVGPAWETVQSPVQGALAAGRALGQGQGQGEGN